MSTLEQTSTGVDPRYPIGKYQQQPFSSRQKQDWINDIRFLPQSLEQAILNLDEAQLNTPYRDGGWTIGRVGGGGQRRARASRGEL